MKLVIDIPEEVYKDIQSHDWKNGERWYSEEWKAIHNGTPLTEKTGRWIEEDMFDGDVAYRCSECNGLFWIESGTPKDNEYNFCPKCGAMLIDTQESEDAE